MKKLLLLSLFLAACSSSSSADVSDYPKHIIQPDTKLGLAPYAIQSPRFNCDAFIDSIKGLKSYNIAYLANTFGHSMQCLDRLWQDDRLKGVEVHLFNEVCVRNGNCGGYEPLYGISKDHYNELLEKEEGWLIQKLQQFTALSYSQITRWKNTARFDVKCWISPGLESNLSPRALGNLIKHLKPLAPGCLFVANRLDNNGYSSGADLSETHNPYQPVAPACIFNNDGDGINFPGLTTWNPGFTPEKIPEIWARFQNCERVFFWVHDYNCIKPGGFVDPQARDCSDTRSFAPLGSALEKLQ